MFLGGYPKQQILTVMLFRRESLSNIMHISCNFKISFNMNIDIQQLWSLSDLVKHVTNFAHAQHQREFFETNKSRPYGYCYDYGDCYNKKVIWEIETVPEWECIIEVTICQYSTYFSKYGSKFWEKGWVMLEGYVNRGFTVQKPNCTLPWNLFWGTQ